MKVITINISEGGKAICSDTNLGRAGEHNNTKIHIIMVDEALLGCDYYRCWFGNKYSTDLIADNGQIMFKIPQDALIPPTVDFQLCGYKSENGVPYVIARSSIITFTVDESACCTLLSDQAFEPFEVLLNDCENAAKAAKVSETAAKNYSTQAYDFCTAALEAVDRYNGFKATLHDMSEAVYGFQQDLQAKADVMVGNKDQYVGFAQNGAKATVVSPDTVATKDSTKLITSGAVFDALKEKAGLDFVCENFIPADTFEQELTKKQDKLYGYEGQYIGFAGISASNPEVLTPDWMPQYDSDKLITSGGVYEAIGNIETVLDNIIALQEQLMGPFKFTISNEERLASPSSTWQDWIDSEYNTDGITSREDGSLSWWLTGDMMLYGEDGKIQYVTDKITKGGSYTWKVAGEE